MKFSVIVRVSVAVALFVGALWWLFSLTNMELMLSVLVSADFFVLALSVPVIVLSHIIRAQRWRRLLPVQDVRIPISSAFSAVMVGYAANTLVPRGGELLRPLLLSQRAPVSFSTAVSSVIVERIIDVLTLLLSILVVLLTQQQAIQKIFPTLDASVIVSTFVIPVGVLIIAIAIMSFTTMGEKVVGLISRPFSPKIQTRLLKIVHDIQQGTSAIKRPSKWPIIALESVAMWTLYIVPLILVYHSVSLSSLPVFHFLDAALMLVIIAIGVTIAPTPGAIGLYQGFAQAGLVGLFGASQEDGLAFGILAWIVNYGTALLFGGICFIIETRRGFRLRNQS